MDNIDRVGKGITVNMGHSTVEIPYNFGDEEVSKGVELCAVVSHINKDNKQKLMYLPRDQSIYISNRNLSLQMFQESLDVYENNQRYYMENEMLEELMVLECWFLHVIEPQPIPIKPSRTNAIKEANKRMLFEWLEREKTKGTGRTYYCNERCLNRINLQPQYYRRAIEDLKETIQMHEL